MSCVIVQASVWGVAQMLTKISPIARLLYMLLLMWSVYANTVTASDHLIDITIEKGVTTGYDHIHAIGDFRGRESAFREVMMHVPEYARLHEWIDKVTLINVNENDKQAFMIEFVFPWPVGRKWSHIQVETNSDNMISWRQIDGSFKKNEGYMSYTATDISLKIDYSAKVDLGYSPRMVRPYIEQFVTDFIKGIGKRAAYIASNTKHASLTKSR